MFFFEQALIVCLVPSAALALDALLGEPERYHPLVGFGMLASQLEKRMRCNLRPGHTSNITLAAKGCVAWVILVLPLPLAVFYIQSLLAPSLPSLLIDCVILYAAIGLTSMEQHSKMVYLPLKEGDLSTARKNCSYLVSRNTSQLSGNEISRAVTESVLENGHDAVIASLFWYVIGGAPLVALHRLANTLDAMWGYKNESYYYFGKTSARMDDVLGWPSAKVTALMYSLKGNIRRCLYNAYVQGRQYKSVNGGWCIASGATALNIKLGGTAEYFGTKHNSPELGAGTTVSHVDIKRSMTLLRTSSWMFAIIASVLCLVIHIP